MGVTGTQDPQVDARKPDAHGPEKKGAQEAYPAGQRWVGVGVPVLVPAGVVEGDAPVDTAGDAVREAVGLPDTDEVADDAGLPDTDDVVEGDAVADADADGVGEPGEDALGTDFRTATLRLEMVALDTPASLTSQLYTDNSAPLDMVLLGTSAVTLVNKKHAATGMPDHCTCSCNSLAA